MGNIHVTHSCLWTKRIIHWELRKTDFWVVSYQWKKHPQLFRNWMVDSKEAGLLLKIFGKLFWTVSAVWNHMKQRSVGMVQDDLLASMCVSLLVVFNVSRYYSALSAPGPVQGGESSQVKSSQFDLNAWPKISKGFTIFTAYYTLCPQILDSLETLGLLLLYTFWNILCLYYQADNTVRNKGEKKGDEIH